MSAIAWVAAANWSGAGVPRGRTIGKIDRTSTRGLLRLHSLTGIRPAMAVTAPVLAIIVAAIGSEAAWVG
jgi:hypothetical protein